MGSLCFFSFRVERGEIFEQRRRSSGVGGFDPFSFP